jgi:hypothetical protein
MRGVACPSQFVVLNAAPASAKVKDEFNHMRGLNRQEFLCMLVRAAVMVRDRAIELTSCGRLRTAARVLTCADVPWPMVDSNSAM